MLGTWLLTYVGPQSKSESKWYNSVLSPGPLLCNYWNHRTHSKSNKYFFSVSLACFIYFTSEISVMGRTEISVMGRREISDVK